MRQVEERAEWPLRTAVPGGGWGAQARSPGALQSASPPARVVYIPGVSFKPGAVAGSWPSPAASGQSPVKICWRTMAGRGGRPSPAPPPLQGGEPALCTAPSPRLASFLDRCPRPGGDALPQPAPRHRGRAPHCFLPSSDTRNVKQAFRACPPPSRPQLQLQPGPSTSTRASLPLPRGHRRRRQKGRKNTGKLLSYLQRARAHTDTSSPWARLLAGAAPARRWPESPFGFRSPNGKPRHTPLGVPCSSHAPRFPGPFSPQNNLTAPPFPMY